jgi:hypothetical protein
MQYIANVKINRSDNTNQMIFSFDVLKEGRVDFNYGIASLTDIKQVAEGDGFNWTWDAQGKTEISIRSRKLVLRHWDKQPKGNWVYYRCRDKTCDFLEKVFESSIIVLVVSGYSKYYSNSIQPLEWKCIISSH